ncbi:MAG: hypothetical protein FWE64_03325 [Alphaproteobacteria bacterium]|nr:hypothetical protein [Alphaproteobacteria bacterium]
MSLIKKFFFAIFVTVCLGVRPVLAEIVDLPAGSGAWQLCRDFIEIEGRFLAEMQTIFRAALNPRTDEYDGDQIGNMLQSSGTVRQIYNAYAQAMSRVCGEGGGEMIIAIAKFDDEAAVGFQFSNEGEAFIFIFDIKKLFDYFPGTYSIMVWNRNKNPGSAITRAVDKNDSVRVFGEQGNSRGDMARDPVTGRDIKPDIGWAVGRNANHRWWSRQCADWNIAWGFGISASNGVSVAMRQTIKDTDFQNQFHRNENARFIIDFPPGDNMRAFPGLLLAQTRGSNKQEVVVFQNLKVGLQMAEDFAKNLKGTKCTEGTQKLYVYLVSLDRTNVPIDFATGKVVGFGSLSERITRVQGGSNAGAIYGTGAAVGLGTFGLWAIPATSAVAYGHAFTGTAVAIKGGVVGYAAVATFKGGLAGLATTGAIALKVPVAGWIVGGAMLVTAGTIATWRLMSPDKIATDLTQVMVVGGPFAVSD